MHQKSFRFYLLLLVLFSPLCAQTSEENSNLTERLHPHSNEFKLSASLLVWTTKEAGADCWAEVIESGPLTHSNDLKEVHFGWDVGFRIGGGYGMKHDQWTTELYYTWFHTRGTGRISSGVGTVHSTFLGNFYINNPDGKGLSGPSYQKASIDWSIRLNMFDWTLGRNFLVSEKLSLTPFLGIKGGWIHQFIHSKWQNPFLPADKYFETGIENIKNNFWGMGPEFGINMKWNLPGNANKFYLFGDFSAALMWGHWSFSDTFKNEIPQTTTVKLQKLKSGASMLRSFMGGGWEINLCQNQYRLSAQLGYEMQFYLDQLQFYSFTGGRLSNQLTLQGGTLEICFNF